MGYFESQAWQQDYTNILKSLILISKRLEQLTDEIREIRLSITKAEENTATD